MDDTPVFKTVPSTYLASTTLRPKAHSCLSWTAGLGEGALLVGGGGLVLHSPSSPVLAEVVLVDITWSHWLHAALQLPGLSLHGTLALWLWLQLLQLLLLGQPFSISGCGSKFDPEQDSVVASRIVGPESALRGLIAHYEVEVHPTARSLSKVVSAATILW